jgi:hypothetical protein
VVWVGRLLRALGLSARSQVLPGHPSRTRSGFRLRWEQDYPAIRAEAAQGGATIYVGDEVASAGVRPAANIISAIMPEGKLRSTPSPALDAVKAFRLHRQVWKNVEHNRIVKAVSAFRMTYDEQPRSTGPPPPAPDLDWTFLGRRRGPWQPGEGN